MNSNKINIYGGGASALFLARQLLDTTNYKIEIFEKGKRLGSKMLVAGKGGFNLSNKRDDLELIEKYDPMEFLMPAIKDFGSQYLREWFKKIGIDTFIGSSGRIFPMREIKPIEVVNAIEDEFDDSRIKVHFQHEVVAWEDNSVTTEHQGNRKKQYADYHVFCLGGASWSITGSDGGWKEIFESQGVEVSGFGAANCGLEIKIAKKFLDQYAGKPLKNISVSIDDKIHFGEIMISANGLEGNAIYPISEDVVKALAKKSTVGITIDLKPPLTIEELELKLNNSRGNTTERLRQLKMSNVAIGLLKAMSTREEWLDLRVLSIRIKALELVVRQPRPIDESISTFGGIKLSELDKNYHIIKHSTFYAIGEMCDWSTITGGYLLQGCFSMSMYLARHLGSIEKMDQEVKNNRD